MKSKLHNQLKILNYISSTDRFRMLFLMLIVLSLYAGIALGISEENFIDSIFIPFGFNIFNIFMFALLFLNTLNTCTIFSKDFSFYIIRLKNKSNYIKELFKTTIFLNLFYFLLFFIFYFMILVFFKLGNFNIHSYQNYGVSNLVYAIFYLGRYVVISILITLISVVFFVNFKEKITMLLNAFFLAGFMLVGNNSATISGFSIVPWKYFSNPVFSSFITEVSFSVLFIFILELIIFIIYNLTLKNKRWVIT